MAKRNVLQFPRHSQNANFSRYEKPQFADLFGTGLAKVGRVAFVDVRLLSETILLQVLVRNSVTGIIDVRPRPVFSRPRFQHKHIVTYFLRREIEYLEYALARQAARRAAASSTTSMSTFDASVDEILQRGLAVAIYDEEARTLGWLDDLRLRLSRSQFFRAELHPRALAGLL